MSVAWLVWLASSVLHLVLPLAWELDGLHAVWTQLQSPSSWLLSSLLLLCFPLLRLLPAALSKAMRRGWQPRTALLLLLLALLLCTALRLWSMLAEQAATSLYRELAVPVSCDGVALRRAYREGVLRFHPDKNPEPDANARFAAFQSAYATLSDAEKRLHYDLTGEWRERRLLGTDVRVRVWLQQIALAIGRQELDEPALLAAAASLLLWSARWTMTSTLALLSIRCTRAWSVWLWQMAALLLTSGAQWLLHESRSREALHHVLPYTSPFEAAQLAQAVYPALLLATAVYRAWQRARLDAFAVRAPSTSQLLALISELSEGQRSLEEQLAAVREQLNGLQEVLRPSSLPPAAEEQDKEEEERSASDKELAVLGIVRYRPTRMHRDRGDSKRRVEQKAGVTGELQV